MQQCPKCGCAVADGRTECNICGAALEGQAAGQVGPVGLQVPAGGPKPLTEEEAQDIRAGIPGIDRPGEPVVDVLAMQIGGAQAAAPQGGTEVRRTLSGEVIEVPVSSPQRPGGPMLGRSGAVPPGSPPGPAGRPASTIPPLRTGRGPVIAGQAAAKSGSSAGLIVLLLVIVLALGGAGGYWYWLQTRPVAAVHQLISDINAHNWGAVYDQIEFSPELKAVVTKDLFTQAMSLIGSQIKIDNYEIQGSKIEGDRSTVTVKGTSSVGGNQTTGTSDIKLVKVQGVWKLDALSGPPGVPGMRVPQIPGLGGRK